MSMSSMRTQQVDMEVSCSVFQCVAPSELQCVATCCNVLQQVSCSVLQCVAASELQCVAMCCSKFMTGSAK